MGCKVKLVKLILIIALAAVASCGANVTPKLKCTEDIMRIEIPTFSNMSAIYLEQLKDYPERSCQPKYDRVAGVAIIELSLQDVFQCGVTRVVNQLTGKRVYYHTVVIETTNKEIPKEILSVKCAINPNVSNTFYNHTITKRNVLPAGFKEDEQLEVLKTFEKEAPKPELGVNVRQGDVPLNGGQLHVAPGTPLQMEIFLDEKSSPIYGLLVKEMQVTDTKSQEETIIFNGCSVDPYLFDNFYTVDGDFLAAKFRAFKFPESTYVQFRGTVNVCLDKCKGVECSNGILGYGRKKREVSSIPPDPNKIFEMTIMSFIKVRSENGTENSKPIINDKHKSKLITGSTSSKEEKNEQVQNEKANNIVQESPSSSYKNGAREEIQYTAVIAETVSSAGRPVWLCGSFLVSCLLVLYLQ